MPGEECANLCRGPERCNKIVDDCAFKTTYRKQLDRLNFNAIMEKFKVLGTKVKEVEGFSEEPVCVLIVYEKPDNPCSERKVLQSWFRDNGYELEEFNKELI